MCETYFPFQQKHRHPACRLALLFASCAFLSCQPADTAPLPEETPTAKADSVQRFTVNPEEITKDWTTWYHYTYYRIRLAQDFIGYDQDSVLLDKPSFLHKLASGGFIALNVATAGGAPVYKLFRPAKPSEDIRRTTAQLAQEALALLHREGKKLPAFRFTDTDGKIHDAKSTQGKILVVKCWFIHCVACVKEFPVLNDLVAKYSHRPDVQFLSFALDARKDLVAFLANKEFRYAVVPDAKAYLENELAITAYPTHLLVDRNGVVKKATNAIEDLLPGLEKELRLSAAAKDSSRL